MNHKLKTGIFKGLALLPDRLGEMSYHFIQRKFDRIPIEQKIEDGKRPYHKLCSALEKLNIDLMDKNILEIGSGWLPIVPYLLKYCGRCREVLTYDIRKHYNSKSIAELNRAFFRKFMNQSVPEIVDKRYNLPDGIKYYPLTDIVDNPPPENSVDVIISIFVLEHLSPEDLLNIHRGVRRYLKKDGIIFHFASSSDHRAYTDHSLSLYDFLQYSQKEWDKIQTRFNYHNRLRRPQYERIFKEAGFSILYQAYSSAKNKGSLLKELEKVDIHPDYQQFSVDELTSCSLVFLLK